MIIDSGELRKRSASSSSRGRRVPVVVSYLLVSGTKSSPDSESPLQNSPLGTHGMCSPRSSEDAVSGMCAVVGLGGKNYIYLLTVIVSREEEETRTTEELLFILCYTQQFLQWSVGTQMDNDTRDEKDGDLILSITVLFGSPKGQGEV